MRKAKYSYKLRSVKEVFNRDIHGFVLSLTPSASKKLGDFAKKLKTTESIIVEGLIENGLDEALDYYGECAFSPSHPKRSKSIDRYGEKKQQKTFLISYEAIAKLKEYALKVSPDSPSEILECAIRSSEAITIAEPEIKKLLAPNICLQ